MARDSTGFVAEALVDFPDDALTCGRPLTAIDIDALMATLRSLGVRRVGWGYYGDGHGGWVHPSYTGEYDGGWPRCAATYRDLGNPLQVAVAAGHRHGLEVYAYFKPYEMGVGAAFPTGSPEARASGLLACIGGRLAWVDPFILRRPDLRIQRRADDLVAGHETATITTIRLRKHDAAPTRLTGEHVQLWVSEDNYRYTRLEVAFAVHESVEPAPRTSRDEAGRILTRAGDPTRVLTLTGLQLDHRFVLVTTDFTDGDGDFTNAGLELMTAYDAQGREIRGVFATGVAIWMPELVDFRRSGLMFDTGWGAARCTLDAPNSDPRRGFIAFARGQNRYLPGALCETEPEVQRYWLACIDEMIAAGVDGVDIREENHSTHTDTPDAYGFNPAVLARCRSGAGDLPSQVAQVRGDAYTAFLAACKRRVAAAGKRLRYHLQLDWLRPDPPYDRRPAYPANLCLDWQRWVNDGLLDAAVLRVFALPLDILFTDPHARAIVDRCRAAGLPLTVNRYVDHGREQLAAEALRVRQAGFQGFVFYESDSFIAFTEAAGHCVVTMPSVTQAAQALAACGEVGQGRVAPGATRSPVVNR